MIQQTCITFIQQPPYIVDFRKYSSSNTTKIEPTLKKRILSAIKVPIKTTALFFSALASASYKTLANSGNTFTVIVLGYYGHKNRFSPPVNLPLAVFKIGYWAFISVFSTAINTGRLFSEKMWGSSNKASNTAFLEQFNTDKELNMTHIQTKDLELDTSRVPATIQVSTLLDIYNEINFNDPDAIGYMSPISRKDSDGPQYSIEALRDHLKMFISNVTNRTAFLGTPRAYDLDALLGFYQQIENAVRLSIHKVDTEITAFLAANPNPISYNEGQKRKYRDLLETKARIAIDLGIAGAHCGARFMGETMTTYYHLYGESDQSTDNLQESLYKILAQRRLEIARGQIQKYLGMDTHSYAKYMAQLGTILALPGTKNITEHLDDRMDKEDFLQKFFSEYTFYDIIDTIQNEIKKSQPLREKIVDWVKEQIEDWQPEDFNFQETYNNILGIINNSQVDVTKQTENLQTLFHLVAALRKQHVPLPANDWPEFWEEVFALEDAKKWLDQKFASVPTLQLRMNVNELKQFPTADRLGNHLLEEFKNIIEQEKPLNIDIFTNRLIQNKKIALIRQEIPEIEAETLERAFESGSDISIIIRDNLELKKRNAFLAELHLDGIAEQGLSKEMMEWLLVSQKIFQPQV